MIDLFCKMISLLPILLFSCNIYGQVSAIRATDFCYNPQHFEGKYNPQTFSFHHQTIIDKNNSEKTNLSDIFSIPGSAELPDNSLWMRVQRLFLPKNHGLQSVQHHFVILLAQQTEVWEHLSVHVIQAWKQYFDYQAGLIIICAT